LQQMIHSICQVTLVYVLPGFCYELNHSNDALPSPYQVTLVGLYFWSNGKSDRGASPGFPLGYATTQTMNVSPRTGYA
jgi:hypothetical protein